VEDVYIVDYKDDATALTDWKKELSSVRA
jgi:hypothetical protein